MREPACTDVTDAHAIEESSTIKIAGVKILFRGGSTRLRLFIPRPFFAVWSETLMTPSRVAFMIPKITGASRERRRGIRYLRVLNS